MPLDAQMVGQQTEDFHHEVDSRWLMAYAAGLGDCNPRYMDTAAGRVIGHPVFPVCLEWPVILASRVLPGYDTVTPEEAARGVHAAHDLTLFKPIVADETYTTRLTITNLESIRPGAAQTSRIETFDSSGGLVARTWQLGISRGVEVTGDTAAIEMAPPPPAITGDALDVCHQVPVAEGFANVYTETARIFNPIHSDRAFALAAGLPDIILHGTATLALAVTELIRHHVDNDPARVRRLGGRFTGMVLMPNTLTVHVTCVMKDALTFHVTRDDGEIVFANGFLVFDAS